MGNLDILRDRIPENVTAAASGKERLLAVAEILRTMTSAESGLTAKEISEVIEAAGGARPSEGKVLGDVHAIAKMKPFGMSVEVPGRGKAGGIKCSGGLLGERQVGLLVHMARTCKFISPEQRDDLCQRLHALVPLSRIQGAAATPVFVDERETSESADAFRAAEIAERAIAEECLIGFEYWVRSLNGDEHPIEAEAGTRFFEIPIALTFSFGSYYLETCRQSDLDSAQAGNSSLVPTMTRRLDKVRSPFVAGPYADPCGMLPLLRSSVEARLGERMDMWGDGVSRELLLRVKEKSARYVYDKFGADVRFAHVAHDGSEGYVLVRVQLSPTFYRWLFGMGDGVVLAKPRDELWTSEFFHDNSAAMDFGRLLRDYEAVCEGLSSQLNLCASANGIIGKFGKAN